MAAGGEKSVLAKFMRIVFFGSSDFSLPSLRACSEAPGHELVLAITTPPQKQGRGLELKSTVVAEFCQNNNLPFREYAKLDPNALHDAAEVCPDIFVVASYGKIIPESFLRLAKIRFNVHPSLLPRYRGASPLNGPILAGDLKTGLSIADVTKDLDAGGLYYQEEVPLNLTDDSEKVGELLAEKSYHVILDLLQKTREEKLQMTPQNASEASYAPKLKKEDGRLSWGDSAEKWGRLIRGLRPWPGAFIEVCGERIAFVSAAIDLSAPPAAAGKILEINSTGVKVATPQGSIEWLRIKPAGKKEMNAADYARGKRWQVGTLLS